MHDSLINVDFAPFATFQQGKVKDTFGYKNLGPKSLLWVTFWVRNCQKGSQKFWTGISAISTYQAWAYKAAQEAALNCSQFERRLSEIKLKVTT